MCGPVLDKAIRQAASCLDYRVNVLLGVDHLAQPKGIRAKSSD
jgi:hypothetical protein